jgi:Polysaccharide pyruvyl transferase
MVVISSVGRPPVIDSGTSVATEAFSRPADFGASRSAITRPLSLRQHLEFCRMARIVASIAGSRPVAYLMIQGNLGDALIDAGAKAFLRHTGVKTVVYSARKVRDLHRRHYRAGYAKHLILKSLSLGAISKYPLRISRVAEAHEVAIICGSGSFCRQNPVASQLARLAARHFRHVIVLPSTYATPLTDYPANMTFFARDRFQSLQYAAGRATFCHDLAFFLNPPPLPPVRHYGIHLRTDNEASGKLPVPPRNIDVSALGTERDGPTRVFEEIGKSAVIVTDRLHLAIAAALLGRRTFLFPGSYFKIPAIYESSIRQNFPHVALLDSFSQLPRELRILFEG